MADERTKVLVVDDHDVVREGLRRILEKREDIEIVAEAASGEEAVSLIEEHRPDICLFDVQLPGMSGIELTAKAKEIHPGCRVVVLTMFDDREIARRAVSAGAIGYVLKADANLRLLDAVDAALRDESLLSPPVARKLLEVLAELPERKEPPGAVALSEPYSLLTRREIEVLKLIAENMSNREIADALYISEHTVKAHVKAIFRKLEVDGRTQAVLMAVRDGLV